MKNKTKVIATIFLATALFFACKKKNDAKTEPAPTPAPVVNPLSATVSGTAFSTAVWYNNGIKDVYMVLFSKNSDKYNISAYSGTNKPSISFNVPYGTGTYTITNTSTVTASYTGYYNVAQDTMTFWNAISGVINITQFDTNGAGSNYINKLKGTFSFSTNVNKGLSHNVTSGNIDYSY